MHESKVNTIRTVIEPAGVFDTFEEHHHIMYFFPCSESDENEEKPEVTITPSVSTNSILKPEDYSKFGMPSGYIFWPTANVFVHPTGQLILKFPFGVFKETKKPTKYL